MLHIQLNWHTLPNRGQVLDNIDWVFPTGCITGVIGLNGAGKSTLLGLLSGWEVPSSGTIKWCEQALTTYSPRELARMRVYLPQAATRHVPMLTVQEIVGLGCGKEVQTRSSLIESAIDWMGLTKYSSVKYSELSGGEQQRVHLARCRVQLEAAGLWSLEPVEPKMEIPTAILNETVEPSEVTAEVVASADPTVTENTTENDLEVMSSSENSDQEKATQEENIIQEGASAHSESEIKEVPLKPNFSVWAIFDEPLQGLDVYYQKIMLTYWRDWAKQHNATIIMSLHQLDIAAQYMDSVLLLKDGKMLAAGETRQVLIPDNLDRLYAPTL